MRDVWFEERGDHFEELHTDWFEGLVDPALLAEARNIAADGVQAHYHAGWGPRVKAQPHPSLKGHYAEAGKQLWHDAAKGRVLLCSPPPEHDDLLQHVVSVPMARVPKRNPDRTLSEKGRLIADARLVNQHCAKEDHPPALQPRHSEMARLLVWWQTRWPGIPIYLSKKDVAEAFRWLRVQDDDCRLFACDLPGNVWGLPNPITALYLSLTFGWRGAPGCYMIYAWVIREAHAHHRPSDPQWEDEVNFHSLTLMDDQVLVEPDLGLRRWKSLAAAEEATLRTLGPEAINFEKDLEEGQMESTKLIWGLHYDAASGTRSLPRVKLEKAAFLLHLPEFDWGNRRVPLRLVQELRGNQEFWKATLPSLGPLLGAVNALLGPADADGMARAKGEPTEQGRTWRRFWECLELQRVLIESKASWDTKFTHPLVSALAVEEVLALPGVLERAIWVTGDATPTRLGAVDWHERVAMAEDAQPIWQAWEAMVAEAEEWEDTAPTETPIIALAELLTVVAFAGLQGTKWRHKLVLYGGDNQNVVQWLSKRTSGSAMANYLLQLLAGLETTYGFRLHAVYLRTYHNADALTREDVEEVVQRHGLNLKPLGNTWTDLLDRGWQKRALIWGGQAEAEWRVALQLAHRRGGGESLRPTPTVLAPLDCVVWVCSRQPTRYAGALQEQGARVQSCGLCEGDTAGLNPLASGIAVTCAFLTPSSLTPTQAEKHWRLIEKIRPDAVWLDLVNDDEASRAERRLKLNGYATQRKQVSGRSVGDQVWWRRVVVMGRLGSDPWALDLPDLEEEPVTPERDHYDTLWLDKKPDADRWTYEGLDLSTQMPHLGAAKPRPSGVLKMPHRSRQLLWDPHRPLPGLHDGSWDPDNPQPLWLVGSGPKGPAARVVSPGEAAKLLGLRDSEAITGTELGSVSRALRALHGTPTSLASEAGNWLRDSPQLQEGLAARFAPETEEDTRTGVCHLPWDEQSKQALSDWLSMSALRRAGGPQPDGDAKRPRWSDEEWREWHAERKQRKWDDQASRALTRLVRHEAGNEACPISLDGWVRVRDVLKLRKFRWYTEEDLERWVRDDKKGRLVLQSDSEENVWVAAWSGHTIPEITGPARCPPQLEVPELLCHGSYKRNTTGILQNGILRKGRDVHLQDPKNHAGRWRPDLETRVDVDVREAQRRGVTFRCTGNLIWLADSPIPPQAIRAIGPWDQLAAASVWGDEEGEAEASAAATAEQEAEDVAQVAQAVIQAAEAQSATQVKVDPDTWEARAAGSDSSEDLEFQPDWSGDEEPQVKKEEASDLRQRGREGGRRYRGPDAQWGGTGYT